MFHQGFFWEFVYLGDTFRSDVAGESQEVLFAVGFGSQEDGA
jgi:hypothetical protein